MLPIARDIYNRIIAVTFTTYYYNLNKYLIIDYGFPKYLYLFDPEILKSSFRADYFTCQSRRCTMQHFTTFHLNICIVKFVKCTGFGYSFIVLSVYNLMGNYFAEMFTMISRLIN